MTRRIAVVTAGLSTPSTTRLLADQLAADLTVSLGAVGEETHVDVVELRPLAHALADNLITGFAPADLAQATDVVRSADALIAVTPVFSASYSGLFKMFFDVLEPELLAGKPVMMGATAGTARHSLVLEHAVRPLFSYLKATPVPTAVFAASEDFGPASDGAVQERSQRAAREMVAMLAGTGVRAERRARTLDEEFAEPTPFAELLGRVGQ